MKIELDEMDELIREANGDQLVILIRLKTLCQQACFHMETPGKRFKQKYREMWTTKFWYEGKDLLEKYFILENGSLKCVKCGKDLKKYNILHHDMYNITNYLNPLYCEIVCNSCHYKIHKEAK